MKKIKAGKELRAVKAELVEGQEGICPLCGIPFNGIEERNIVVDHDHSTGVIRGALHRGCNGVEGKVLCLLKTWGKCRTLEDCIKLLESLKNYWIKHKEPQTEYLYPEVKKKVRRRRRKKA